MLYSPWLLLCLLRLCNALTTTSSNHHKNKVMPQDQHDGTIVTTRSRHHNDRSIHQEEWRQYCPGCQRPLPQCLCEHLPPEKIKLSTQVLVLQHPVEFRRKTISTVPLLKLILKECRVMVGRSFDAKLERALDDARDEGRMPLLLFPGTEAITLEDVDAMERLAEISCSHSKLDAQSLPLPSPSNAKPTSPKYLLIIVDGTWTQAKRMLRNSPLLLERCQSIQFTGTSFTSIYDSIRKQPDSYCLSTLESCERTLQLLEPHNSKREEASRYLLDALKAMILTQMKFERRHLEKRPDLIRNVAKLRDKRERQEQLLREESRWNGQDDDGTITTTACDNDMAELPEGYSLRPLVPSDAAYVNSRWPFRSNKSLVMIEKQILADNVNATKFGHSTCLGIEFNDELVACIIRHRNGSLGILHVDEDHRRCGLGAILLRDAMNALVFRKDPVFAFIIDGNKASEAVFAKLGWKKENPLGKKGTGKRRAKRLWIYSPKEVEQ